MVSRTAPDLRYGCRHGLQAVHYAGEFPATVAGILLSLAFAPYRYGYAALPVLMLLYWLWSEVKPGRAARIGYFFGLGFFGAGLWWTYISIHDYGGADPASAGLLTVLLVGVWALCPALAGFLVAKTAALPSAGLRAAASAGCWSAVEYLRGEWLLNGFPWLQIAYSQIEAPLAGFAPLAGVYGIGFLLVWSAFMLAETCFGKLPLPAALLPVGLVWLLGGGLKDVPWTHAVGDPLNVTLLQGNVSQALKWQPDLRPYILQHYRQLTEQHWDSAVVVWPETAIPAFLSEVQSGFLEPLAVEARAHRTDLIVSLPTDSPDGRYFNSVLALGTNQSLYHKIHLLPFGEYLPLQPLSGWVADLVRIPLGDFTAGSERQPLPVAGGFPFVATVCYEDAFGAQVGRRTAAAAYIVNVSDDAWFGDSAEPYQHMQIAQMRALETGRFLVRATNTGITGFIGPNGAILQQAPPFSVVALTGKITPMGGMTPYMYWGDAAAVLLAIAAAIPSAFAAVVRVLRGFQDGPPAL